MNKLLKVAVIVLLVFLAGWAVVHARQAKRVKPSNCMDDGCESSTFITQQEKIIEQYKAELVKLGRMDAEYWSPETRCGARGSDKWAYMK